MSIKPEDAKMGRAVYVHHPDDEFGPCNPGIIISKVYDWYGEPMIDIAYCKDKIGHKYLKNLMLCHAGDRPYESQ